MLLLRDSFVKRMSTKNSNTVRDLKSDLASDLAADKALKRICTIDLLRQLNLFETIMQLYSLEGLTPLEKENLDNQHNAELERKSYLLTNVIPSKGNYKGMQLLRQALKQTEQYEILRVLEKAYEDAVSAITDEDLELLQKPKVPNTSVGLGQFPTAAQTTELCASRGASIGSELDLAYLFSSENDLRKVNGFERLTSISSHSSSDTDGLVCDSPKVHQQLLSPTPSHTITIQLPISPGNGISTKVSLAPLQRERSDHICYKSNPYKTRTATQLDHSVSVTIVQDDTRNHGVNNANDDIDANTENVS